MGKLKYIFYVVLALTFASCEKVTNTDGEIELPLEGGYITFSTSVSTKAPIITSLRGREFGVMGFKYPNYQAWTGARPLATPNLCYDLTVRCDANGVCSYDSNPSVAGDQFMLWELLDNHTFFSYFPKSTAQNGVSVSAESLTNTPRVIYNLPIKKVAEGEVDPDNLQDVMTGYAIDQTVKDGTVTFKFQHRLSCVDVIVRNFNDATQSISDVKVRLGGIKYNKITVPMYKDDSQVAIVSEAVDWSVTDSVDFRISTASDIVQTGKNEIKAVNAAKNIILIPQEYDSKDPNDKRIAGRVFFKDNGVDTYMKFSSDFSFKEGVKYSIVINFTGDDIIVLIIEAGLWDDVPVQYEFE